MPVIGSLSSLAPAEVAHLITAFRQSLNGAGYVEGRNVAIEYRWAQGQYDRLSPMAADLVDRHVAVIVAWGPAAARAAKAASATIPIVFSVGDDPVAIGLVASLNRPGGNATGINLLTGTLVAKRLELLSQVVPTASSIAFLVNPKSPSAAPDIEEAQAAAQALGRKLNVLKASAEHDVEVAFSIMREQRAGALLVGADPFFTEEGDIDAARQLVGQAKDAELFLYPGDQHYFADSTLPSYDPDATALLLQRVLGFLRDR